MNHFCQTNNEYFEGKVNSLLNQTLNETGKLGSDKLLNDSAILESYEKQTLLRYETSKKDAMKVDVRHGREHKQYVSQQVEEKKKVILQKKQLQAKQKNDVKKHARFLPEVKEI